MMDTSAIESARTPRALDGVVVLDLSRILAGPWATQMLGDLGAEVIKIERPVVGDDTRQWGPPFLTKADGTHGEAAYYTSANRNKRSVCVDMASPEGADILRRLALQADVVVENFKTGGLKKYGLDYASLSAANPKLVYCSITGFGQTGPYASRAGYDYMIQAMGGLMSITGRPDEEPGGEPMKSGVAVADLATGLYACNAILAGLLHARATGEGQHIDIALFDVQAAMLANQAANWFVSGETPGRVGNAHPNLTPYQVFATEDGAVVLAVGNDGQFSALCAAAGAPGLATDPRFLKNADRIAHRKELVNLLAPIFTGRTTQGWMRDLEAVGVPCGPINTIDQVFAEPQAVARGLMIDMPREDLARPVRMVASPLRLSKTPPVQDYAPPGLGVDTAAVLARRLGLSEAELAALQASGAIGV